ncbi:hypothetical protein F5X99DRAFT_139991 [Biscogniauxia marginata]|nr:hypothetical protein F5X99DRAFT_139991 [Biscogniauxia marginata]
MSSTPSSQTGAVLLTGGTGKVASLIAPLLQSAGIPAIIGSRSGKAPEGFTGVKFDWTDKSTWGPALSNTVKPVESVFIVFPRANNPGAIASEFVDLAREKGVSRFVLLSASAIDENGLAMGEIHRVLKNLGDEGKIAWAVLRPTWFQENFYYTDPVVKLIKEQNKITSATGQGKVPWVSTQDIANVGFFALTSPKPPNRDFVILGPELLTYTELAEIFTLVLGRKIQYEEISEAELAQFYVKAGLPADYAHVLASFDTEIKNGGEDQMNNVVLEITGKRPRSFREFVEANKATWA